MHRQSCNIHNQTNVLWVCVISHALRIDPNQQGPELQDILQLFLSKHILTAFFIQLISKA